MQNLIFVSNTVLPVFLVIGLGLILRKIKIIDHVFIKSSSELVFKVSLPCLIFAKLSTADFFQVFNFYHIIIICTGVVCFFIIAWLFSVLLKDLPESKGSFIQGAFRSNVAIIAFAIIINVFGESGLAKAAVFLIFLLPIYNILSVIALTYFINKEKEGSFKIIIIKIITNPLILAVIVSLPFSFLKINVQPLIVKTISYLSQITLPLALIGIGGSLSFDSIYQKAFASIFASIIKIVLLPVSITYISFLAGVRGEALGVIFVITASPTAVASFIMAKAMHNDSDLAANIILITTFGSVLTIGGGIFVLKTLHLI